MDMENTDWITSEFSIHEVLYMGSEHLTHIVEGIMDEVLNDPFDFVARLEEEFGAPIIYKLS